VDQEYILQQRLLRLVADVKAGKVKFRKGSNAAESLLKLRFRANGDIDLTSVDGIVRAMALALEGVKIENLLKDYPLHRIQAEYFALVTALYGNLYDEAIRRKLDFHEAAATLAASPENVKAWIDNKDKERKLINAFWEEFGALVHLHLTRLRSLKAVFGGDISPSYTRSIATTAGLYIDTMILPDPLLKTINSFQGMDEKNRFYYTVKHALNILSYRDLVLADVNPPVAVIAPDLKLLIKDGYKELYQDAETPLAKHASIVFKRKFRSIRTCENFVTGIKSIESLVSKVKAPDRLVFDLEDERPLNEQLKSYLFPNYLPAQLKSASVGSALLLSLRGRMMQAGEIIENCNNLDGTPLIDAPTSWQYFLWRLEYDQKSQSSHKNLVITRSIQLARKKWVPMIRVKHSVLIDLRKKGVLADLRSILANGIQDIKAADEKNVKSTVEAVVSNLNAAFLKHKSVLEDARKRKRTFLVDSTKSIVWNGLSIAGAVTGDTVMSSLGTIGAAVGIKGLADLFGEHKKMREEIQNYRNTAAGIFFTHVDK